METQKGVAPERRRTPMDRVFEGLGAGLGNGIGWLAETGVLFAIFALLWVGFGVALVVSQGSIDQAWQSIRALPLLLQLVVWLLFLPVMIGLWVWETSWPLVVRLLVVFGVAGWNLLVFLPKSLQGGRP
jgi:hypothetical protein